jgi:hypothetical protein
MTQSTPYVLTEVDYYKERRDQNQAGGSAQSVEVGDHSELQESSQWSHTGHTDFSQQHVVTTSVKCHWSGKLVRDEVSRVFIGGWSHDKIPNHGRKAGSA